MVISWQKIEKQVAPYSRLVEIYDEVMYHVDYYRWANYIHKAIKRWNPRAKNIVDIACGTGNLISSISRFNYDLFGFDYSFASIEFAKNKLDVRGLNVPLWQSNMTHFSVKYPVDVIICLYDSINYLLRIEDYLKALDCVYNSLENNGLFIFDICSENNSIKFFSNYFERNGGNGYQYSRRSSYNRKTRIHSNIFKINFVNSEFIYVEKHEQRIFLINEVLEIIKQMKFKVLGAFNEFSFRPASEKSMRIHFILKKVS